MRTFFTKTFVSLSIVLSIGLLVWFPHHVHAQLQGPTQSGQTLDTATAPPPNTGASKFVPLVGLPGLTDQAGDRTLADYINVLYRLAIGIGALLAVIKITYAGIKYMSSDAFSSKEQAKKDITGALFGLLIMLSTVVILQLIYPNILNINVLQGLKPVQVIEPTVSAGIAEGGTCTGASTCAAGACYKDKSTCTRAFGQGESGQCSASCTPTVAAGPACTATADCAALGLGIEYHCGVRGKGGPNSCGSAQNGEAGQCLTSQCKAPPANNLPPT